MYPVFTMPWTSSNRTSTAYRPEQYLRQVREYVLRPLRIARSVRPEHIPADLIAGCTVASVAIPQAIAYASIAELPPHMGLSAAAIAAVVGALWGSSRHLSTGPVNALSLLVLPVLLSVAIPGSPEYLLAASVLAVMAGIISIGLALMRFGALVTLASRSVLLGFIAGVALHIAIGQLRHLLGIAVPAYPELYENVRAVLGNLPDANMTSVSLGAGAFLLMILLRRIHRRIPASLTAITLASVVVSAFGLDRRGVAVVGDITSAFPAFTLEATGISPDMNMIWALLTGAAAVAALGLVESMAASQTLARRAGDRLDFNQEFFGQGLANIASGLFSGFPSSGSFTRSALAQQAGARTHLTGVFTGLTILLAMVLLSPFVGLIPRPAIAGVLMIIAWRMVDRREIRRVVRTSRADAAIMGGTFLATLVLPLDFAILSGIVFSLALFVLRSSLPRVDAVVPDDTYRHLVNEPARPVCPQLGIMNIRGPLFFGAVYHVEEELRHNHERHPGQRTLVLRMHGVDICDMSGVEMLESTVEIYRRLDGDVYLVRPRKPVMEVLRQSGFIERTLGRDHILPQEGAIEYLFGHAIDKQICTYECEYRVFSECHTIVKHVYGDNVPPAPVSPEGHPLQVPPEEFKKLMGDPQVLLLDVREPVEHRRAHIPGAESLPLRELLQSAGDLPRDRRVLLACRSGRRSARALFVLEELGYARVRGLRGGILAWRAAGLPVELEDAEGPAERNGP